jgi:hypothetical protein
MNETPLLGEPGKPRRRWRAARWMLLGLLGHGCVLDSDDLCGPGQVIWGDDQRCICGEGLAYTAEGCVPCGANETASTAAGCVCNAGYARPAPAQACAVIPDGIGDACDSNTECLNSAYSHCQLGGVGGGYCTTTGCTGPADCTGGFVCETSASPTYCKRPPFGAGRPCTAPADCADTEATFCDTIVSQSCLVQNCTVTPNDCFAGMECCPIAGLPNLCIPQGACTQ